MKIPFVASVRVGNAVFPKPRSSDKAVLLAKIFCRYHWKSSSMVTPKARNISMEKPKARNINMETPQARKIRADFILMTVLLELKRPIAQCLL